MTRNKRNQIKILIVEDELLVAQQVASYLKKADYTVIGIFDNGDDAIDFLNQDSPDLILMDIELKGKIDGVEAAAKILETINIPVIYLTKLNDFKTLDRVKSTAPAAYLTKPFKNHDIRIAIEMAIYKGDLDHQKEARHEIKLNLDLDIQNNDGIQHLQNRIFYKEANGGLRKLLLEEVIYLEQEDNYISAHTISGVFKLNSSLDKFLDQIKNSSLIRIHEKYIVNLVYIHQIIDNQIVLDFENNEQDLSDKLEQLKLPLSNAYKESFYKFIENQII